jgi:hypothetical protein
MRLRLSRLRLAIGLILLWGGAATRFWITSVPLLVTEAFTPDDGLGFSGLTADGNLVLHRRSSTVAFGQTAGVPMGPIGIWNPQQHALIRQSAVETDRVMAVARSGQNLAAIDSGDTVNLIELTSGRVLQTMPADETRTHASFSDDGQLVAIFGKTDGVVSRVDNGQSLWRHDGNVEVVGFGFLGPDLFYCSYSEAEELSDLHQFRSTHSWERDERFEIQPRQVESISVNGDWAVVRHGLTLMPWLWNLHTARPVMQLPPWVFAHCARFTPDSQELIYPVVSETRTALMRWNASTGQPLTPIVSPDRMPVCGVSPDGRFIVADEWTRDSTSAPLGLVRFLNQFGLGWDGELVGRHRQWRLVETASHRDCGFIDGTDAEHLSVGSTGFVAHSDQGSIRFIAFPGQRNWMWLAGWTIAPTALIAIACGLWPGKRTSAVRPAAICPAPIQ